MKDRIKALDAADRAELARNNSLPANLRIAAKQSFYNDGYTNANLDELTDDEIKKLVSVIDTSEISDFDNIKDISNIERDDNGKLKSFKMTAQSGNSVIYTTVNVVDGELIFNGYQGEKQQYVIQKDTEGKYHLMQYEYHDGWNSGDLTRV